MHGNDMIDHDAEHLKRAYDVIVEAAEIFIAGKRGHVDRILEAIECDLCVGQAMLSVITHLGSLDDIRVATAESHERERLDLFPDDDLPDGSAWPPSELN